MDYDEKHDRDAQISTKKMCWRIVNDLYNDIKISHEDFDYLLTCPKILIRSTLCDIITQKIKMHMTSPTEMSRASLYKIVNDYDKTLLRMLSIVVFCKDTKHTCLYACQDIYRTIIDDNDNEAIFSAITHTVKTLIIQRVQCPDIWRFLRQIGLFQDIVHPLYKIILERETKALLPITDLRTILKTRKKEEKFYQYFYTPEEQEYLDIINNILLWKEEAGFTQSRCGMAFVLTSFQEALDNPTTKSFDVYIECMNSHIFILITQYYKWIGDTTEYLQEHNTDICEFKMFYRNAYMFINSKHVCLQPHKDIMYKKIHDAFISIVSSNEPFWIDVFFTQFYITPRIVSIIPSKDLFVQEYCKYYLSKIPFSFKDFLEINILLDKIRPIVGDVSVEKIEYMIDELQAGELTAQGNKVYIISQYTHLHFQEIALPTTVFATHYEEECNSFILSYISQHPKKKYSIAHEMTVVEMDYSVSPSIKYSLRVNIYQACILLLFNETDTVSINDIPSHLHPYLKSLARLLTITPTNVTLAELTFPTNKQISLVAKSPPSVALQRRSLLSASPSVSPSASSSTPSPSLVSSSILDRRYILDCHIIRVLKKHAPETVLYQDLASHVIDATKMHFVPTEKEIKERTQHLIAHDYIIDTGTSYGYVP